MIRYIFLLFLSVFPICLLAQTGEVVPVSMPLPLCSGLYQISGPEQVKIGSTYEYEVSTTGSIIGDFSGSVTYTLRRDRKIVETVKDRLKYLLFFSTPGESNIEAKITPSGGACEGTIMKRIHAYSSIFTYIGAERSGFEAGMRDIFEKNNILSHSYIEEGNISASKESQDIWNSIDQTDILVIGSRDILGFFSDIVKLQKTKQINFSKKTVYIISDFSRSFLSKVIASPLSQIGAVQTFLISEDQFYGLLTRVSAGNTRDIPIGEELSYQKSDTIYYSLNRFIEFLAYSGFSYQLLAFFLSLTFVVLILNILKQIVGFNVFGIYYPILFAITIAGIGFSAFVFIIIGTLVIILVNAFTQKVTLLLHAKRSLLISLYIVLLLFALGIDNFFGLSLIDYAIFDNLLVIFPLFIIIILVDRIFQEDINIFRKSGILDIIQYGIVTYIVYRLLDYKTLQYFLISYPDSIILVVLLNILVGRYMGLQIFEYFRFAPLLRKLDEEE